jgi:hypothetical protein
MPIVLTESDVVDPESKPTMVEADTTFPLGNNGDLYKPAQQENGKYFIVSPITGKIKPVDAELYEKEMPLLNTKKPVSWPNSVRRTEIPYFTNGERQFLEELLGNQIVRPENNTAFLEHAVRINRKFKEQKGSLSKVDPIVNTRKRSN